MKAFEELIRKFLSLEEDESTTEFGLYFILTFVIL